MQCVLFNNPAASGHTDIQIAMSTGYGKGTLEGAEKPFKSVHTLASPIS